MSLNLSKLFGLGRGKTKHFSAWQVELTTRCSLMCRMCIRQGCEGWHTADMDIDNFRKLTPYFKYVESVVLEGWGESLLHKNLVDAVKLVKVSGSQAGFVASGKGLDRDKIHELVNAGVDFVGFSLAGATSRTHNSIRINSDLENLLIHIKDFVRIKADKKLEKPRLHIVYLLLKENISEVSLLLKLAKKIGLNEVVLANLIHVTDEWQEGQRVFGCESSNPPPDYEGLLKEAEQEAGELKIKLRRPNLSPDEVAVCEENPLRNLYISVEGEVSPCVYLHPPALSPFKRIFCGKESQIEKVSFGNIFREPFESIWNNKAYIEFRECFRARQRRFEKKMLSNLVGMETFKGLEIMPLPGPPFHCLTCHKMLGL